MATTLNMGGFLRYPGNYKNLLFYKKTVVLYDMTAYFCGHWLDARRDRTVDQMVQAARSGKQNIAEGSASSGTSKETEIKLTNVARASLDELFEDYEDHLKSNGLTRWSTTDRKYLAALMEQEGWIDKHVDDFSGRIIHFITPKGTVAIERL